MLDTVVPLPLTPEVGPNDEIAVDEAVELTAQQKLMALAAKTGDLSAALDAASLAKIGIEAVEDYERDKKDRQPWEDTVTEALDKATQANTGVTKNYPWKGASNVNFPILTTAALQFNARMLPAVIKGDEAVLCKVIGQDNGKPQIDPQTGQPAIQMQQGPDGAPQPVMGPDGAPHPVWAVPPQSKARRARRVSEYLNTTLFYRMEDWESDTDTLLMQLPVIGCAFRKLWFDASTGMHRAALVSALRIFVPQGARSVATSPRLTEELPDVYPFQISEHVRSGHYRDVDLMADAKEDDDGPRLLLEQHRLIDMDDDGVEEPYIVTVDHQTSQVLRIEANFGPDDVRTDETGRVLSIKRGLFYIKYDLFPDPKGGFYGLGLGHLLRQLGDVIDTAINQLMDAGHAQTAGGGFIASGVRLQARGGGSTVTFRPGEYKTVDVPGNVLRDAIVEKTLPNVSPVTFQVLDMILGAARDISGAKDVITGDASNQGQVGTTLALIEQGLQVFNATAKRTFRSLKDEFTLLKENIRKYGGEAAAQDYAQVLDDPEANFEADFASADMDIRPVSDPSAVTRMQKAAKGQFIMSTMEALAGVGGDPREALRRVYEAADIEDIDKLLPPPQPTPPDPRVEADAKVKESQAAKNMADAHKTQVETQRTGFDLEQDATVAGMAFGALG